MLKELFYIYVIQSKPNTGLVLEGYYTDIYPIGEHDLTLVPTTRQATAFEDRLDCLETVNEIMLLPNVFNVKVKKIKKRG